MNNDRPERQLPEAVNPDVTSQDESQELLHDDVEEVKNPYRVEETPIYGFWKPAIVLLILGLLAILLARGLF